MRNRKTLIAAIAFLLLFSSVANAGWWSEIKDCISGPSDEEIGAEMVKEKCDAIKEEVKSATGDLKSRVEGANSATEEIDDLLEDYNNICDEIPVDELETEIDAIDAKIDSEIEETVREINDKYKSKIKPKIDEIEGKIKSYSEDFDQLCEEELVQTADEVYTAVDSDLTDVEGWVNGLPADADSIISGNGGDDATYQKFNEMYGKLNAIYEKINELIELIGKIGELCKKIMDEIGGVLEEIGDAFDELDDLCEEIGDFINDEVLQPIKDLLGGISISEYIDEKLTKVCGDMTASIEKYIEESDWDGFLCELLEEVLEWIEELIDFLDVFLEFWYKLQRYLKCFNCLESQLSELGNKHATFESQASNTCNPYYEDAKKMYVGLFEAEDRERSNSYLFAIYDDPEFENDAKEAEQDAKSAEGEAVAYLKFNASKVSEYEGCGPDSMSSEGYGWGSEVLNQVAEEAGVAKFTLYSVLAQELLKVVGMAAKLIGKLLSILNEFVSIPYASYAAALAKLIAFASKVLNVFLGIFNALTGTCQKISDSQDIVDELTVPNKEADKLDKWFDDTPYMKIPVVQGEGVLLGSETSAQEIGSTYYGVFSSPEGMLDKSPESYGDIDVSKYMRPLYLSKPNYIEFIEEWNKQIGYDVTQIIKEMPITATTWPVEIELEYGSFMDEMWADLPSPICVVKGLFRTVDSMKNEGWAPLEMPYKDHEVMWTEIFGISPDIEMRDTDCNILIYDFGSGEENQYLDLIEILEDDHYDVDYHEREGEDITSGILSAYCQVWFIDGENSTGITATEVDEIVTFHEAGGKILLTGNSISFSNINQIASAFEAAVSGFSGSSTTSSDCDVPLAKGCIYPSFIPHEITNGVTSISQHELSIEDTDSKELCTHSDNSCTLLSGNGSLVIDSSSERFSKVLECENSRYARNIARYFSIERWSKTGDIQVYVGGGCTRYHEGTNMEDYHLYCENPLTLIEDIWSPYPLCSWLMDTTMCWKGGNDRGTVGWYHGPIEDWVNVTIKYTDSAGEEHGNSYIKKGKTHTDDEDTINSYFVVDAVLPSEARDFKVEAEYSCKTRLDRQVYNVDCGKQCRTDYDMIIICFCIYSKCWYVHGKNKGCIHAATETIIDTSTIFDSWKEIDSWMTGDSLVRYGAEQQLEVDMEGSVEAYGNQWEADLSMQVDPDIISSFSLTVGDYSLIDHQERFYPVKHEMTRRYSASGVEKKEYNIIDRWGHDSSAYNFPQQCKKICPPLECECPDSILEPICWDPGSEDGYTVRTDCACAPRDGQENPCVSDRSFHEDDGIYYDFVRLTAYDLNEMGMMEYTPTKTMHGGILAEGEITKEDGIYEIHFMTETTKDPATDGLEWVTEEDIENIELMVYTPVELAATKSMSEWTSETTTSVPTTSTVTTSLTTTLATTTTIGDTCTPACSADPDYEACDATYYAYCRASCNSGEETPPGGLGNDWCQSAEAKDLGVSDDGYVCCCCCVGGTCS